MNIDRENAKHDAHRHNFNAWKKRVDQEIAFRCGLTSDDLPDVDFWAMFYADYEPKLAAEMVLENACEDMGMDYDDIFGEG